jgi:hypothetical protein
MYILECLHVDGPLEHHKHMRVIMRIHLLVRMTKILAAIDTPVPSTLDALYAQIACHGEMEE